MPEKRRAPALRDLPEWRHGLPGTAAVRSAGMAVPVVHHRHGEPRNCVRTATIARRGGGVAAGNTGTAADEARIPGASNDPGSDAIRTRARRGRSAASARIEPGPIAPASPECMEHQAADFVGAGDPTGSHAMQGEASGRDTWTAGGLRAVVLSLPTVGAELFIQAGSIVAERAVRCAGSHIEVEAILRRASDQAASLLRVRRPDPR